MIENKPEATMIFFVTFCSSHESSRTNNPWKALKLHNEPKIIENGVLSTLLHQKNIPKSTHTYDAKVI